MNHCNFEGTKFIGISWIRDCDAKFCNFSNADVSKVSYANTNFDGSRFCGAIIKIGTKEGSGVTFPQSLFDDLCKGWSIKLISEKRKD
jgi:uncharacterized protein YjbI with pentapeptide repeats